MGVDCRRKKRYRHEEAAVYALRFLVPRGKRRGCLRDKSGASAYFCPTCRGFHIGHSDRQAAG